MQKCEPNDDISMCMAHRKDLRQIGSDTYLRDYVGCKFPVEGEVAEDAFVQLLYELHEQGVRVHLVVEEGQQILFVALGLLEVIVR